MGTEGSDLDLRLEDFRIDFDLLFWTREHHKSLTNLLLEVLAIPLHLFLVWAILLV